MESDGNCMSDIRIGEIPIDEFSEIEYQVYDGWNNVEVDDWIPAWDDLPEWVKWVAQDSNGDWHGFIDEPENIEGYCQWMTDGEFEFITTTEVYHGGWENTLTKRPEKTSERISLEGKVNVSIGKPSCISDILSDAEIDALLAGVTQDEESYKGSIVQQSTQPHYQTKTGTDFIQRFSDVHSRERVRGALLFSIGKYCERYGEKDATIKEAKKIVDYANRLLQFEQQLEEDNYE